MHFLAQRFSFQRWWSVYSERGSQDLCNSTKLASWLDNSTISFYLHINSLHSRLSWQHVEFVAKYAPMEGIYILAIQVLVLKVASITGKRPCKSLMVVLQSAIRLSVRLMDVVLPAGGEVPLQINGLAPWRLWESGSAILFPRSASCSGSPSVGVLTRSLHVRAILGVLLK